MTIDKLKMLSESAFSFIGLMTLLIVGFFIFLGLLRKAGKDSWVKTKSKVLLSNGKKRLIQFPTTSPEIVFWKDPSLINTGFSTSIVVLILSAYIPSMLIFNAAEIEYIGILLAFPNAFFPLINIGTLKSRKIIKHCVFLIVMTSSCTFLSYYLINIQMSNKELFIYQILILIIQTAIFAFIQGINDAFDYFEISSYPLVEIITKTGDKITGLRFSKNSTSEYRFINPDNYTETIFPREQIFQITTIEKQS